MALLISAAAAAVGLTANALRPEGITLVATLPYEQDCPDKDAVVLQGPTVVAARAAELVGQRGVLFLDARPAEDFAARRVRGARSLPLSFIAPVDAATAAKLKGTQHLIVYCDSPDEALARRLAAQLEQRGLSRVKVLLGGLVALDRACKGACLQRGGATP